MFDHIPLAAIALSVSRAMPTMHEIIAVNDSACISKAVSTKLPRGDVAAGSTPLLAPVCPIPSNPDPPICAPAAQRLPVFD